MRGTMRMGPDGCIDQRARGVKQGRVVIAPDNTGRYLRHGSIDAGGSFDGRCVYRTGFCSVRRDAMLWEGHFSADGVSLLVADDEAVVALSGDANGQTGLGEDLGLDSAWSGLT
jgi:hypothetical protein